MTLRLRTLSGWLCIISLLLLSALPAARPATVKSFLLEICTARGLERIAVADLYNPASKEKQHHPQNNHCPLCLLRFAGILPENPAQGLSLPLLQSGLPDIQTAQAAVSACDTHPAQPRAPPSLI